MLNAAATPVLAPVNEDAGAPVGAVGTLVSSLVNLNPPSGGGLDNVTDADATAVTGIALTGTNGANGTWYFSTNNGGAWTAVSGATDGNALLLAADADTRLYFQANLNFNGTVTNAITFRAWDQSSGTAGSYVDSSTNGGSTAFSSAIDSANLTVQGVNDPPVAASDVLYVSNSTTVTLSLATLLGNDTDIDGLALTISPTPAPPFAAAADQFAVNPTLNGDGTFSFTTDASGGTVAAPVARTFTYTLSDGAGGTTVGTVTVNVLTVAPGNTVDIVDLSSLTNYQAAYIDARAGADTVTDGSGLSVLLGGVGADALTGNAGNDLLIGDDGNDDLTGGWQRRTSRGIGNNDSMNGGTAPRTCSTSPMARRHVTFTLVQACRIDLDNERHRQSRQQRHVHEHRGRHRHQPQRHDHRQQRAMM